MTDLKQRACAWIIGDDTGLSSKVLWATMMGVPSSRSYHPSDPDDMGRCLRLLRAVPEWQSRLPEMSAISPCWAALIARWADIEATIRLEVGGIDPRPGASAPGAYALMKIALDGARKGGEP